MTTESEAPPARAPDKECAPWCPVGFYHAAGAMPVSNDQHAPGCPKGTAARFAAPPPSESAQQQIQQLQGALRAATSALLVYVKAHDSEQQKELGPEYTTAECMCDTCCGASDLYTLGGPPDYKPPPLANGTAPKAPIDSPSAALREAQARAERLQQQVQDLEKQIALRDERVTKAEEAAAHWERKVAIRETCLVCDERDCDNTDHAEMDRLLRRAQAAEKRLAEQDKALADARATLTEQQARATRVFDAHEREMNGLLTERLAADARLQEAYAAIRWACGEAPLPDGRWFDPVAFGFAAVTPKFWWRSFLRLYSGLERGTAPLAAPSDSSLAERLAEAEAETLRTRERWTVHQAELSLANERLAEAQARTLELEGALRAVTPIAQRAHRRDLDRMSKASAAFGEPDIADLPESLRIAREGALLTQARALAQGTATPTTENAKQGAGLQNGPLSPLRKECGDNSPSWWTGRWRDWHRGHGCSKDDGKPCTPEGVAEFAAHGRLPGRLAGVAPKAPSASPESVQEPDVVCVDCGSVYHASCLPPEEQSKAPAAPFTKEEEAAVLEFIEYMREHPGVHPGCGNIATFLQPTAGPSHPARAAEEQKAGPGALSRGPHSESEPC